MAKGRKTGGRRTGTPNKLTGDVKGMILGALGAVGGQQYLQEQALNNPNAFLALVGRTVPKELKAEVRLGLLRMLLDGQGVHSE